MKSPFLTAFRFARSRPWTRALQAQIAKHEIGTLEIKVRGEWSHPRGAACEELKVAKRPAHRPPDRSPAEEVRARRSWLKESRPAEWRPSSGAEPVNSLGPSKGRGGRHVAVARRPGRSRSWRARAAWQTHCRLARRTIARRRRGRDIELVFHTVEPCQARASPYGPEFLDPVRFLAVRGKARFSPEFAAAGCVDQACSSRWRSSGTEYDSRIPSSPDDRACGSDVVDAVAPDDGVHPDGRTVAKDRPRRASRAGPAYPRHSASTRNHRRTCADRGTAGCHR